MELSAAALASVDLLIEEYTQQLPRFDKLREVLHADIENWDGLRPLLHSVRSRVKEPDHLRDKIVRKSAKYFGRDGQLILTIDNLPFIVTDLVGVRLLHLYTRQFGHIKAELNDCLRDNVYVLREGPIARVWDSEQKAYYESICVETKESRNLYTSVHYVVGTSTSHGRGGTAEIQVRTLADELWGEVDHLINYPNTHHDAVCREQIAVLARITSGASRLTDSIFLSHERSKPVEAGPTTETQNID
jgi:putative GTP pyrophosphokinase